MFGVQASWEPKERWKIDLGYWTAMNEGDGLMTDYDWLLYSEGSPWTDYSLSDAVVEEATMLDLNASYRLVNKPGITLWATLGFKNDFWEWSDRGIRYVYSTLPPSGFRDDVGTFNGNKGIEYEQNYRIPYFGIQAESTCGSVQVSAWLYYSPVVSATDEDYHIWRDLLFEGDFDGGDFLSIGIRGVYPVSPQWTVEVSFGHQRVGETVGDVVVTDFSGSSFFRDGGGISHRSNLFSLSVGYRF